MPVFVRCGSVALLCGLMLAAPAARAESSPAWTDPPVRGSAAAQGSTNTKAETKPAAAKPEGAAASETKPTEARSEEAKPVGDGKPAEKAAEASPAAVHTVRATPPRAAFQGISPYRRPLVRSWPLVRAPLLRQRAAEAPRRATRRPIVERRFAQRDDMRPPRRQRDFGYRTVGRVDPYDGRFKSSYAARRRVADWGELIDDERAQRMTQARAMGYRVMRLQTYELPDGRQVRELMPLDDLD